MMIKDASIKNVLIPLIEHFVSDGVSSVEFTDSSYIFKTNMGNIGVIKKNMCGDWDVIVEGELIYEIENEIMDALVPLDGKFLIHEYYHNIIGLCNSGILKYRSKSLINQIRITIEYLILNSGVKPIIPIKVGPFLVYSSKILGRNLITLN